MATTVTDYTKTNWTPGLPITLERMGNIENLLDKITDRIIESTEGGIIYDINRLKDRTTAVESQAALAKDTADTAASDAQNALTATAKGENAWSMLEDAGVTWTPANTSGTTLKNIHEDMLDDIREVTNTATSNQLQLGTLREAVNGAASTYGSLSGRFAADEGRISINENAINEIIAGKGDHYDSLSERLNAIDGGEIGFRVVPRIDEEVKTARGKDENNNAYSTLSARLAASDAKLSTTTGVANGAIQATKIINNTLDSTDPTAVLGGQTGGVIKNAIATAKQEAISSANDYADTKIPLTYVAKSYDVTTDNYVLSAERGHDLNDRLTAKETEINTAHISSVIRTQGNGPRTFTDLDERFETVEGIALAASNEIEDAHRDLGIDELTNLPILDSLVNRFEDIEQAQRDMDSALDTRIDAIDGGSTPSRTLPDIITEVNNARTSSIITDTHTEEENGETVTTLIPHTYGSIDARLEAIESHAASVRTDVNTIAGELAMMDNNALVTTNTRVDTLENDLRTMARELDMLDGTAIVDTNTRIDSIEDEIGNAHRTGLVDDLDQPIDDTLVNRFEDAESRISTLETDISSGMQQLDTRLTTAEGDIDTLEAALNTPSTGILARLTAIDDANNGALAQLDDRIDTINDELDDARPVIGTDQETGDPIYGTLDNRFDSIDNTISHTASGNDPGGIMERLTDVEGVAATALQPSDLTSLNTTVNGLVSDVADLLNADTIVVFKPTEEGLSNYTNDVPNMSVSNIVPTADYLIEDDDGNFFYWRYMGAEIGWKLISGAGGSGGNGGNQGGGNTSGMNLTRAEYDALVQSDGQELNTDYYVTETSGLVRHFRYTYENDTWTEIEVGPIASEIYYYNAIKTYDSVSNQYYLDLYKFPYGTQDVTLYDNNLPPVTSRVAHILLPQGGGGGASAHTTIRFTRIPPTSITTILNNDPVYINFFYSCVDTNNEVYSGTYVLTNRTGVELARDTINSGNPKVTVDGWPNEKQLGRIYDDGYGSIDVSKYCTLGDNTFTVTITTETHEEVSRTWTVKVLQLNIESDAPESAMTAVGQPLNMVYRPFGAMDKTLIVKVDGVLIKTETLVSDINGSELTVTIPSQSHGAHTISLALSAEVNNTTETTEPIIRDYIWYDANNTATPIIITSPYRTKTYEASQYSEVTIPYTVYNANSNSFTVKYYYDYDANSLNTPFDQVTLTNTNTGEVHYTINESSDHTITIQVGETMLTILLSVTPMPIDIAPVDGAIIDFNPANLTNNSINKLPTWTANGETYHLTVSENFNWSSHWEGDDQDSGGGYRTDEDGKCFIIKAGTYAYIDYKMFKQNATTTNGVTTVSSNVFDNGAEMKLIFKVSAVRDASAIWFTNMGQFSPQVEQTVGIQLKAHEGVLMTDKAKNEDLDVTSLPEEYQDKVWSKTKAYAVGDVCVYKSIIYKCIKAIDAPAEGEENKWNKKAWESLGLLETEIAATNSYLYFPYSEEDKIELDININKHGTGNFIMSYEDGVPSKAYPYNAGSGGDILYHVNDAESIIQIGSPDCDVHIYRLRIYPKALTTANILKNFIADGLTIDERVIRYNRNAIYYDRTMNNSQGGYTPYKIGNATLNPYRLAERIPDVKILMLEAPRFTVGKKDFIKGSTLRCLQAEGGKVYPGRADTDNWYFYNGYHAGQGTTSDNYGQSARNVDFLFECDGTHAPTATKNLSENEYVGYQSHVIKGNENTLFNEQTGDWTIKSGATTETCTDWKGDKCKISLTHNKDTGVDTSVPNNYFNLKVNVASSENVNNALFQKRYNDFLPYESPGKRRDSRIKNDMEFVPAVLFIRETGEDSLGNLVDRKEFNDDQWHFYALGNIGDSKKTDYTRAYDPEDMNEFTVEISDNNTANSQFQSGVFFSEERYIVQNPLVSELSTYEEANGEVTLKDGTNDQFIGSFIATTDTTIDPNKTYYYRTQVVETAAMADDPEMDQDPMKYQYAITSEQWNALRDATAKELEVLAESGSDIYLPEGKTYVNHRHHTLVSEPFDGDHSFEFRYACRGDYRDGDLINDTSEPTGWTDNLGNLLLNADDLPLTYDNVQFDINRNVWFAFYEWVVTATKAQFRAEATQWFIPSAVEFFYAYTHYYTMMDNRAKNTFWHFAKTGQYRRVTRPVKALYQVYEVADGEVQSDANGVYTGSFTAPTGEFNPNGEYYTQYAFDLWVYDTDTACGIDNNGELSFPYGKEDTDYRVVNQPRSGWAFNGSGSIFWRRLSAPSNDGGFASEIATIMRQEDDCFANAQNLIDEFDRFLNCFPEEIWRLDIERKYIRTYTGNSYDNSITTNKKNERFLRSMMQGRKKYQRRQWVRNQAVYFGSKYGLSNIHTDLHIIEFATYNPLSSSTGEPLAVPVNQSNLIIVPYQDMYIDVATGNSTTNLNMLKLLRAKAGERVSIDCRGGGGNQETRVYIFGGEYISAIENLAPMYMGAHSFSLGKHLKVLNLGSENENYDNPNLRSLTVSENMPLLETLNIKNCKYLTGSPNLSQSNNLRVVEATGSAITGISLPDYTAIETLHLPSTVANVTLRYARMLTDFSVINKTTGLADYSNIHTLMINESDYSSNINWIDIAKATLNSSIEWIHLLGLETSTVQDIVDLQPFVTKKRALETDNLSHVVLSGTVEVLGDWSQVEKDYYEQIWSNPPLDINVENGTYQPKCAVIFKESDYVDNEGNIVVGQPLCEPVYVDLGALLPDIYYNGTIEMPTRESTVRTIYTFGIREDNEYIPYSGWKIPGADHPISMEEYIPTISSDTTIETYYSEEDKQYKVRWFMKRNTNGTPDITTKVKESSGWIGYGGGENLEAPTIAEIHAAHQKTYDVEINGTTVKRCSIFNGWEKLPINISPTDPDSDYYDIFASWDNTTIPVNTSVTDIFANVDNLTPEQLMIWANLPAQIRTNSLHNVVSVGKRFSYEMGHDSIHTGTALIQSPLRLRQSQLVYDGAVDTGIIPFNSTNDAFTIMIDYCFDANATYNNVNAAILMGCHYQNEAEDTMLGFALYYNTTTSLGKVGPRVGFGKWYDSSTYSKPVGSADTADLRNVVVLRHPKDEDMLYIYSGLNDGKTMGSDVIVQSIRWSNIKSDAKLYLGRLTEYTTGDYSQVLGSVTKAAGTIYQAKYWNEDLGVGECKRLAMWPHEKVTYYINLINSNLTSGSPADTTTPTPSIGITTLTATSCGRIVQSSSYLGLVAGTKVGWDTSVARTVCNNRVFLGLPTKFLAVLSQPATKFYRAVYGSDSNNMSGFTKENTVASVRDYIYLLSESNVNAGTSEYENETANVRYETAPLSFVDNGNVTLYLYTTEGWAQSDSATRYLYENLRFPVVPLNGQIRIFKEETALPSTTTAYTSINGAATIHTGDIYITTGGQAYMYVATADLPYYVYGAPNSGTLAASNGTWIPSKEYWLRSMTFGGSKSGFMYINNAGSIVSNGNNGASANGLSINYSLSI